MLVGRFADLPLMGNRCRIQILTEQQPNGGQVSQYNRQQKCDQN